MVDRAEGRVNVQVARLTHPLRHARARLKLKADKTHSINRWQKENLEKEMEQAKAQMEAMKEEMQDEMRSIAERTERQKEALVVGGQAFL